MYAFVKFYGGGLQDVTFLLVVLFVALGAVAVAYAWSVYQKMMAFEVENPRIVELSGIIHRGAMAFLMQEYTWLAAFVGVVTILLWGALGFGSAFAFVVGAACSAGTGWLGMYVATQTNGRTTFAATRSAGDALDMAFSGGSIVGMLVVGIGLIGVSLTWLFLWGAVETLAAFGMGASSIALFARVGGGIYTKAADVGADLVGKIEAGIPEDDPRNPAVIADNVGDNVGDIAGMSADLFESYVNSIIAAMAIGVAFTSLYGDSRGALGMFGASFPLFLAGWGIISSIVGCLVVATKNPWSQIMFEYAGKIPHMNKILERIQSGDAAYALRVGAVIAGIKMIGGSFILSMLFFVTRGFHVFLSVTSGVVAGVLIGFATEYCTSSAYKPVRDLARASETGTATVILSGFSLGMKSTAIPVVLICLSTLLSYWLAGVFGVACAAVGMLSITGIALAVDAYGPISDNAGGIAQMSDLPSDVRKITDKLDSIGNTTAAMGKGLAIGSAALTALALFVAYAHAANLAAIDIMQPKVVVGLLLGGMLPFLFCSLTIEAVGRAAQAMIDEVRRQFREIAGIMEGTGKPEYEKCVSISATAALREMIVPGVLAICAPLLVGFFLGKGALGGLLGGAIVSGVMLALFMANSGGAWDNAKKYIEEGNYGGKGTPNHSAAVVGDTVGDPFKDTAGPSLNILIKLMTVVALVLAPLFS
ncbi:MAG: sodium-translocating pyrophosphatase [Synergistaceae bacterium]|jgi:K(+)-stimulated pyrophosphate-energized sodium pump|nr:sodium-translocating pyrophosphatase [Synergistaceae bacterium]